MLTLVFCGQALAQTDDPPAPKPLILTDQREQYPLGLYLEILEDPSGELTIEDVSSPEFSERFIPSQTEVSNYGFTDSAYWVRYRLSNETRQTNEWLLEQGFAHTHFVDLYTPLSDSDGFSVKQTGVLKPISTRDIIHPNIVFSLTIPAGSQQTYYLRFQNGAAMTLSLTLWTKDAFLERSQTQQIVHGLFYGILIGLLVYNLFLLFFSFREASSLYYVTFLASFIFFLASYDGFTQIYLFLNQFSLAQYYIPLSWALIYISTMFFANDFLNIKSHFHRLYQVGFVILGVWGLLIVLTPLTSYHVMTLLMAPWALLSLVAVLSAGVISLKRGFYAARFFLIAWSGLLVSLFLVILIRLGVFPSTIFSENAFRLGLVWLAVCWSIALADRINLLRAEKNKASLELQASEIRYRTLIETMNDGLGVIDQNNHFSFVNNRLAEMLGYPAKEITGRLVTELMDEDNQSILQSQIEQRKLGFSDPYQLTWMKKDGSEIITLVSPMPLFENRIGYSGSFAVITDITEQVLTSRLLEQRVYERTQELSSLLEISRDVSAAQDVDVILQRILEQLKRVVAYSAVVVLAEQEGKWISTIQDWPSAPGEPERIVISASQVQAIEKEFIHKKPILINNPGMDDTNVDGFRTLVNRFSNGWIPDTHCWLGMPLLEKEKVIGTMAIGCAEGDATEDQVMVIETFANQIAIIIENNRLYRKIQESVTTDERNRLANELHDSVTQTLFTASVLAEATPRIWENDMELARQNMLNLSQLIRGALAEMRSMLIELRMGSLHSQNLSKLLTTVVDAAQGRSRARFHVSIIEVPQLSDQVTYAFYRVAREALNNVIVHSGATRIIVSLSEKEGRLQLIVQDNGRGFNPEAIPTGHLGLKIMNERAAEIGGDLRIQSKPGSGTYIVLNWHGNPGGSIANG